MALQFTEQIIFDHIQSNRNLREFWEGQIAEIRLSADDDDELVQMLSERLGMFYMGNHNAQNDLSGLVNAIDLMGVYYPAIAFSLLGRDLQLELVSEACKPPAGLEQDQYYLLKEGKKLGPYTFAEIKIKWNDEKINPNDKVYLNSKSDWLPIIELVAPWIVEGNFYLFSNDGTKSGPFTDVQIKQMWTEGKVTSEHQYWNEGKKEYCPISDLVKDLPTPKPVLSTLLPPTEHPPAYHQHQGNTQPSENPKKEPYRIKKSSVDINKMTYISDISNGVSVFFIVIGLSLGISLAIHFWDLMQSGLSVALGAFIISVGLIISKAIDKIEDRKYKARLEAAFNIEYEALKRERREVNFTNSADDNHERIEFRKFWYGDKLK